MDYPQNFEDALAQATGTRDAITAMTEARAKLDADAAKLRASKAELQADRKTDPVKLGREVSALDHALDIVKDRRDAVTLEIEATEKEYVVKLRSLAGFVGSAAEGRVTTIMNWRRAKVMALAREHGCTWAFGTPPTPGQPGYPAYQVALPEMANRIDTRLSALHGLINDSKVRYEQSFPHLPNAQGTIQMAERLMAALESTKALLPPEPEPAEAVSAAA